MYATRSFFCWVFFCLVALHSTPHGALRYYLQGVETRVYSSTSMTRHDTAGRWMRGGPGGCAPDMSSRVVREGNRNAKKSEKLERGTCVRERLGMTALSLSCSSTRFFFCLFSFMSISRYRHHRHCRLGTSWCEACKETPLRSVSAERLHNHMNISYHPRVGQKRSSTSTSFSSERASLAQ